METLTDLLAVAEHKQVTHCALTCESIEVSYGELDRRAGRIAHELRRRGVTRDTRIAILSRNDPAFFEVWFGAMKCAAVLLPVNFRLGACETHYVMQHAGIEVLFVSAEFEAVAARLACRLPRLRHLVCIGESHHGLERYEDWTGAGGQWHDGNSRGSDIAILIYTSGTTGSPKGVQLSHAALIADLQRYDTLQIWLERDVMMLAMPLIHLGGIGFGLRSIYRAAHMVLLRDFDPRRLLECIEGFRVTKMLLVPTMIRMVMDSPTCEGTDLSSLHLITYGAAPMPPALLLRALRVFRCGFGTGYGLTESGGAVSFLCAQDHDAARPHLLSSCGKASGAEIRIVSEGGCPVAAGVIGEIIIRSPQLMTGYLDAPEETAHAIRDGWLYSGDAGYLDAQGYLYICDRIKDMIVSGGENIYPAELEAALMAHPAVAEAAVIGVPDERWGEVPKALVILRAGATLGVDEMEEFLRRRLAAYKLPRSVDVVETFPRNAAGKILKRQLRGPYWPSVGRQVN